MRPRGMGHRSMPGIEAGDKTPIWPTLRRLLAYLTARHMFHLAVVMVCIILSALANVRGSMFIQTVIDDHITPLLLEAEPAFTGLLRAVLIMAAIYLVGVLAALTYSRVMVTVSQGVLRQVRDDMFTSMQGLPVRYFDTHSHGDLMSHYTNDTDMLRQMVSQSIPQVFSSVVTVVMVSYAMISLSGWLTLVAAAYMLMVLGVARKISSLSGGHFAKQQDSIGALNGYIEELINGQKVVKVFCREEHAKREFDARNEELCRHATSANTFGNLLGPVINNLGHLQYVLIAIGGGYFAIAGVGELTLGAIAAFLALSRSFTMPISRVSQQLNSVVMALAGAGRIFGLMDAEPEADDGQVTLVNATYDNGALVEADERTGIWAWKHPAGGGDQAAYTELRGDVRFCEVTFEYEPGKTVLHNISLYAKPGQKIAFVGPTGAGKTTITNLLNRFYDVVSGEIRYDGIDIQDIRKKDLRRSLAMVLQDTNLFSGTVMDNIRYGNPGATDEEVLEAARLANAHEFISRLPQGYDTVLKGSGGLSEGQRQLLSIARAAVAGSPVMILDEATSSIDTRTEAIVQEGMNRLMQGRTVFVIAHRLSTVQKSEAIMVLENGRIIERGDHEELMKQGGTYCRLYAGGPRVADDCAI